MGRFVVIEGLDGAGTTTQTARLVAWLAEQGRRVVHTHEPTDGAVGRVIRRSLRGDPEAPSVSVLPWLFAADRADHLARTVEPALARGEWVVSDRYLHSSLAYQSATMPLEDVLGLNATFRIPDLTVFVELDVGACLERIGGRGLDREIYERRDQLDAIAVRYEAVLARLAVRGDPIVRLDGRGSPDEVEAAVRAAVAPLLP